MLCEILPGYPDGAGVGFYGGGFGGGGTEGQCLGALQGEPDVLEGCFHRGRVTQSPVRLRGWWRGRSFTCRLMKNTFIEFVLICIMF